MRRARVTEAGSGPGGVLSRRVGDGSIAAACTLWLPALVPLVAGLLRDCSHCFWSYVAMLPLVPGVAVPAALGLDDAWFFVTAGLLALLLFALLVAALQRLPRAYGIGLRAVVVLGVAAEAIGLAQALRA